MTDTAHTEVGARSAPSGIPRFDYPTVIPIAVAAMAAATFGAGRYHLFGDELYFIAAGNHPSPGYADQGPVLPLLARLGELWPGEHLILFRLPSLLITLVGLLITVQIAREFGGGRLAQTLAAGGFATSPFLMMQSNLLATNAIDTPLWVAITWLVVRWVRTRQDYLLLAAGAVTALDMQVKWLIPLFWVLLIVSSLALGPRELVRRPLLWAGGALTVLTSIPALLWQAERGWPYLQLTEQVKEEMQYSGGRIGFVPIMLLTAGILGGVLMLYGLWRLARGPEHLRPYRFLALTFVLLVAFFVIFGGRPYYASGMIPLLIAAGAVEFARITVRPVRWLAPPVAAASVAMLLVTLPYAPESEIEPPRGIMDAGLKIGLYGQFGWPELTRAAEKEVRELPADRRPQAVITNSYWQASALAHYTDGSLPPVFSPGRGYGYFGQPADTATTVLWIGSKDSTETDRLCSTSTTLRTVTSRLGFPTASTDVDLRLCQVRDPWSKTWPGLRRM